MIKRQEIIFLLLAGLALGAWKAEITIDTGRQKTLFIGMDEAATDGFDKELDKPCPPIPPVGFYCYFPLSDTLFEFIDALWGDIRKPSAEATWSLRIVRAENPVTISVSGLPRIGILSLNGFEVETESLAFAFTQSDMPLEIRYSHGFYEAQSCWIEFESHCAGMAKIAIIGASGEIVRSLPEMRIASGQHKIGWSGRADSGETLYPAIYDVLISLNCGDKKVEIKTETMVEQ